VISITSKGDYKKTLDFLNRSRRGDVFPDLNSYGRIGVNALRRVTPVDTGLTASSWDYRIIKGKHGPTIEWFNTNGKNGTSVAILIQYGHATGTGGYVIGKNYINPAMHPLFDTIANDVWKAVMKS
jgi:hypothetical protein